MCCTTTTVSFESVVFEREGVEQERASIGRVIAAGNQCSVSTLCICGRGGIQGCTSEHTIFIYNSVPGNHPWVLKHNSRFWPAWALTRDINSIGLYRSCHIDPLKCATWALAWDTTVLNTVPLLTCTHIIAVLTLSLLRRI